MSGNQRNEAQRKNRGACAMHEDVEQHMSPDHGHAIRHQTSRTRYLRPLRQDQSHVEQLDAHCKCNLTETGLGTRSDKCGQAIILAEIRWIDVVPRQFAETTSAHYRQHRIQPAFGQTVVHIR